MKQNVFRASSSTTDGGRCLMSRTRVRWLVGCVLSFFVCVFAFDISLPVCVCFVISISLFFYFLFYFIFFYCLFGFF